MQVVQHLKRMSDERFLAIYQALEQNGYGPLDGEVAKAMRFRPHAIKKLPMPQRARKAKRILEGSANAELAYELFGSYLMREHKDVILRFLDATGVEHEDGMISNVEECRPAGDKVAEAVAQLDADFPEEEVTLYLSMCAEQWPGVPEVQQAYDARVG